MFKLLCVLNVAMLDVDPSHNRQSRVTRPLTRQ